MTSSSPRVSVLVPLYNTERFIERSVSSLLDQRGVDVEVVVIDDGSTDDSFGAAARVRDNRVKLAREEHRGIGATLNTALSLAQGDYIAFQGADDVSLPSRLSRQVAALRGGSGFSHCDMVLVDATEGPLGYQLSRPTEQLHVLPLLLRRGTPFNNGTILMTRALVEGTSFDPSLRIGEDTDHVRQIAPRADSTHVGEPLYLYRRHDSNTTRTFTPADDWAPLPKLIESSGRLLAPELASAYGDRAEPLIHAHIGMWLFRRGHGEQASRWLARAADHGLDAEQETIISAMIHSVSGQHREAFEKFTSLPETSVTLCGAGEATATLQGTRAAFPWYQRALVADPDNVDALRGCRSAAAAGGIQLVDDALTRFR